MSDRSKADRASNDLMERVALRDKAVLRYQLNKHAYRDVVAAAITLALEEAADAVGAIGDHADAGAYINAIRALIPQEDK
jgi:hypothetical protein